MKNSKARLWQASQVDTLLIFDNLRIQVPAETECHYENPGLDPFAAESVGNDGAFVEIHLRRLTGGKIQDAGGFRLSCPEFL
ncbi:MAG: hypothetical protein WA974_03985 [Thermodesulfobacteriota bacterium]